MNLKNPFLLLMALPLLIIVILVYWDLVKRKKFTPKILIGWRALWDTGNLRFKVPPRFWPVVGFSIATVFFIIALARPQSSVTKIKRSMEGIDIMLVLDISASMRIEDFHNQNRFDTAKQIIKEFILGRQSDKIGLEVFSGEPATLVPPTLDYSLLLQSLLNVQIGDLKDGTAIGDALATGVGRLKDSKAKSRILILVTDGDSNVGQVDPLTAGDLAQGYGIRVYSIAIGRDGRVAMPFINKDIFGRQVKTYQYFDSSINPELLRKISAATNGKFYRVEDDINVFREVFREIDRLERVKIETTEQVKYNEKFMWFLQIGLLILGVTFLLQNTVFRVYP